MSKIKKVIYIDAVESKHLSKQKNSSTLFVYNLCCLSRCGRDFPSIGCVLQNGVLDSRWYKTAGFLQFGTALQQFVKSLEELAEAPASGKARANLSSKVATWSVFSALRLRVSRSCKERQENSFTNVKSTYDILIELLSVTTYAREWCLHFLLRSFLNSGREFCGRVLLG